MYQPRAITVQEYLTDRVSDLFYKVNDFVATLSERLGILESDGYNPIESLDSLGIEVYHYKDREATRRPHKAKQRLGDAWYSRGKKRKDQPKEKPTEKDRSQKA